MARDLHCSARSPYLRKRCVAAKNVDSVPITAVAHVTEGFEASLETCETDVIPVKLENKSSGIDK